MAKSSENQVLRRGNDVIVTAPSRLREEVARIMAELAEEQPEWLDEGSDEEDDSE